MTQLRRWTWIALAGSLLLAMLAQALAPIPRERIYIEALLDAGHVPLFTVFTLLVLSLLLEVGRVARRQRSTAYILTLLVAIAMGAITELLQSRVGRDADFWDFVRDLCGAGAAIALAIAWRQLWRSAHRQRAPIQVGLLVLVAFVFWGFGLSAPLSTLMNYRARDAQFPVLASFDGDWERTFVRSRDSEVRAVAPPPAWKGRKGRVLRVRYEAKEYPAVILQEPVSDWSAYDFLEFDVYNPDSTAVDLIVRIDDNSHNGYYSDRYHGTFSIGPGVEHLVIPLEEVKQAPRSRAMNLRAMHSLTLFLGEMDRPWTLYFDHIELTRGEETGAPD